MIKILNIFLMTVLFIHTYHFISIGVYFPWELAMLIILVWDYKLTGWED